MRYLYNLMRIIRPPAPKYQLNRSMLAWDKCKRAARLYEYQQNRY
jgi:hypothetical protein